MSEFSQALTIAAPIFNLLLVAIVVYLFIKLFRVKKSSKKVYLKPWYFLFAIICIFVLEEVITVLRAAGLVTIPGHINGFFELAMVSLMIYLLLLQKEHAAKYKY